MSEPLSIRKAIDRLTDGTIRIPGFQRSYVWEPERAAVLMDSVYKGYPIGSILLWRTGNRLKTERKLGVFHLPEPDKDYPIDYVLDGQQRLTSMFSAFQTRLKGDEPDPDVWLPIYYDFDAEEDAQDSRFVALKPEDEKTGQHFPLAVFFDPVAFSKASRELPDARHEEIVKVQQKFLEALIPVQTLDTEDRATVAIVFERVNRMGIELDIFQLLTAWTWSDEFDLQEQFADLAEEFAEFGFQTVGEDPDLMLRCTAAVLQHDPSPAALIDVNGGDVRERFDTVAHAIRRSIDFVRSNFHVRTLRLLPYASLLIPLSAFFSIRPSEGLTSAEREALTKWFWRSCFSQRYSGNPQRNIRRDIEEAVKLRNGDEGSALAGIPCAIDEDFFIDHKFSIRTVATKSFILLLAHHRPRSFLSGEPVALEQVLAEPNRHEYHHCYPRSRLVKNGRTTDQINMLANFAIISRAENRKISGKLPSKYRSLMPEDADQILSSALIPDALFEDDYDKFSIERSRWLASEVESLIT